MRFLKVISNSLLLSEAETSVTSVTFLMTGKDLKNLSSEFLTGCPNLGCILSLSVGEMQMKSFGNWAKGMFLQMLPSCTDNHYICLQQCFV